MKRRPSAEQEKLTKDDAYTKVAAEFIRTMSLSSVTHVAICWFCDVITDLAISCVAAV